MIKKYDLDCVQGVQAGTLLYEDGGEIKKINLKKSAELWWDKRHKTTFMAVLLRKRARNVYVGDKRFNYAEPYIRTYVEEGEIFFTKKFPPEVDASEASEFRTWWNDVNRCLNQQGYWLFDEG